ncbi:hypothetical protein PAXRUDRAFT_227114 [Paxillus rubicundulus Ve08.2h10]|uniref:Uncharacterized protein n=1 Tax=Paxillus rubicundulus Ve08.2h10 TaxID=930991 RepID=A0A0D0EBC9_9AGAM|nr:hypothetical protein PAXRUDRAFT_227114 [Paxillus rubicundulus Ve08.2h10]
MTSHLGAVVAPVCVGTPHLRLSALAPKLVQAWLSLPPTQFCVSMIFHQRSKLRSADARPAESLAFVHRSVKSVPLGNFGALPQG